MVPLCAFHSAAIASAIPLRGATTRRPEGVRMGAAVERDGKTASGFRDAGFLVVPLAPRERACTAHRLLRIERRMSGDFVE